MGATELKTAVAGPQPDGVAQNAPMRWYHRLALWRALAGMAIAVALACAAVALETSSELFHRNAYYHRRLLRLLGHIHQMRGQIDSVDRELAGMRDEDAADGRLPLILAASDVRLFRLSPPRNLDGKGFVAISRKVASAVIEVCDLPPPAAGQHYTLWWTFDRHAPVKAAQFRTAADGRSATVAKLPPIDSDRTAALVTVEHGDAAAVPAGEVKLRGSASRPLTRSSAKSK
jgi:hypothetical protein